MDEQRNRINNLNAFVSPQKDMLEHQHTTNNSKLNDFIKTYRAVSHDWTVVNAGSWVEAEAPIFLSIFVYFIYRCD